MDPDNIRDPHSLQEECAPAFSIASFDPLSQGYTALGFPESTMDSSNAVLAYQQSLSLAGGGYECPNNLTFYPLQDIISSATSHCSCAFSSPYQAPTDSASQMINTTRKRKGQDNYMIQSTSRKKNRSKLTPCIRCWLHRKKVDLRLSLSVLRY